MRELLLAVMGAGLFVAPGLLLGFGDAVTAGGATIALWFAAALGAAAIGLVAAAFLHDRGEAPGLSPPET